MDRLSGTERESVVKDVTYARGLIEEGRFEEAQAILEKVQDQVARALEIKALKSKATYVKPYRSNLPIIAGAMVLLAGVVLYLK